MNKLGTKQVIPMGLALLSALFLFTGLKKFGFWNSTSGPTPAFVPSIICTLMLILSLAALARSFKEAPAKYHRDELLFIFVTAMILVGVYLIGMLPALSLFVILWLRIVEKAPWKTTLLILLITMGIMVGVFVVWLHVRFPVGIIFEMLT